MVTARRPLRDHPMIQIPMRIWTVATEIAPPVATEMAVSAVRTIRQSVEA